MAAIVEFDPNVSSAPALVEVLTGGAHSSSVGQFRPGVAKLVVLGLLSVVLALVVVNGAAGEGAGVTDPQRSGEFVVVGPGDTMLSIAEETLAVAGPTATSEAVTAMAALNGGPTVEVGQVLALPALG